MKNQSNETSETGKFDVYAMVTERILALLDKGVIPWRKPWQGGSESMRLPYNAHTKKPYSGVNVFLLMCTGYEHPAFVSFKQAQEMGGCVRKGEKGFPVVFWKRLPKTDRATGKPELDANGKPKMVFLLRYYTVFNVAQCDGLKWEAPAPVKRPEGWEPLAECEKIVSAMPKAPVIRYNESRAYYSPALDLVNVPKRDLFPVKEEFYSTLFHELTHATGHKSRLARKGIDSENGDWAPFGSAPYAREELVAEMGAAFLCGHSGIVHATLENSAAYIANWKTKLREDSKLVVMAASQAQKAANFILNVQPEESVAE